MVDLLNEKRRQKSREDISTQKNASIATAATHKTRKLKKDRMKKKAAPMTDTKSTSTQDYNKNNIETNYDYGNVVPAIIYQVMEPKKDRFGNQAIHKKNDTEGSAQKPIDKILPSPSRGGRFSLNVESTPKSEGYHQKRVTNIDKGTETGIVYEVTAGKESD